MNKPWASIALATLVMWVGIATVAALDFDLERDCLDCHRPDQRRGDVPLIEGQQAGYLRVQLADFRDRHCAGFPMSAVASGMDESAMDSIAQALAARPWQTSSRPVSRPAADRGARLVLEQRCTTCHGDGFVGTGDVPRLAGQTPGYLQRQIAAFADGERRHPISEVDGHLYTLDQAQARDIAAHLHALP